VANPRFAALLDRAEDALEAGNADDALTLANEMLGDEPDDVDALDLKAVALRHLGEVEAAIETYERLKALEPKNPAWPLSQADLLVRDAEDDRDLIEQGLEVLEAAERLVGKDPELRFELELLRATALNQLGDFSEALASIRVALDVDPSSAEAQLEQGQALFELGRFDEARRVYQTLARDFPDEAWAHHALGLLAERRGEDPEPHFARARSLAPEEFPPPVHLSPEAFDEAVAEAIEALPEHAKPALDNCLIDVQPIPSDEDLKAGGVSPLILGVFRGAALDERSPVEASDHQTAHITLYQNNLERFARTREELLEEIRITVLHEVGHLLGLDEDELYERGLD
jgi:predicted Zn-dependent protease with MMP-like domain/Flp pilus assembly protein TadD